MISLTEASKRVGRSKSALLKAIKSGRLSAVRGSNGAYSVDIEELILVYGERTPSAEVRTPPEESRKNSAEVRTPPEENSAHLERRIADLERERDFLRERLASRDRDVERLTFLLAPPIDSAEQVRGGARTWLVVLLIVVLAGAGIFLASGARLSAGL